MNWGMEVLQTSALPLGYAAASQSEKCRFKLPQLCRLRLEFSILCFCSKVCQTKANLYHGSDLTSQILARDDAIVSTSFKALTNDSAFALAIVPLDFRVIESLAGRPD